MAAHKKMTRKANLDRSALSGGLDPDTGYPKHNTVLIRELGKLRSRVLRDSKAKQAVVDVSTLVQRLPA